MRRHLAIIVSVVLLAAGLGSAVLAAHAATTSSGQKVRKLSSSRQFVGYWMGIDPLDGGDSRRGITWNQDRTFSVIGRDTVFTLCDGTDRAIVTVSDAVVASSALVSDNLIITCTNTDSTVELKVRYDVIDGSIIRETVTTQSGEPVDEIIFHRVSRRTVPPAGPGAPDPRPAVVTDAELRLRDLNSTASRRKAVPGRPAGRGETSGLIPGSTTDAAGARAVDASRNPDPPRNISRGSTRRRTGACTS